MCRGDILVLVTAPEGVFVSGPVTTVPQPYSYLPGILVITGASGGQPLGSGLTTSGYTLADVTIKIPEVKTSGTSDYDSYLRSGNIGKIIYVGGASQKQPYPGSGFVCSGKGLVMAPGDSRKFYISSLDSIWVTSEISGNPLSYVAEIR